MIISHNRQIGSFLERLHHNFLGKQIVLHLVDVRLEVEGLEKAYLHLVDFATLKIHHHAVMSSYPSDLLIVVHLVRNYRGDGQQLYPILHRECCIRS